MKISFKYRIVFWLCCCLIKGFCQKENNIWYFGTQAGLNFSITPPAVLSNGVLNTSEGCAAVADANGNLLFYTDGSTIYNKLHSTMANGAGLNGHSSTTQAAVIVKEPSSSNIYYVFSLGAQGTGALKYSTVDMSLSSGNGSVTVKNTTLSANPMSEKLTSVKHCNGVDFWVVAHESGNNNFLSYLVTASGVSLTPVVSPAGSTYTQTAFCGNMKISPNGSKLGVAIQSPVNSFELFDFNNSTGVVSNSLSLGSFANAYGCEFSSDGTKFYGSREYGTGSQALFQWDLCAGSNSAIIASEYSISTSGNIYGMQLATDGKIYIARFGSTLAVVHNPNAAGSACSYTHNGLPISPGSCNFNLPNFVTSGFKAPPPPFTFTVSNLFGCQGVAFTSPAVVTNTSSTCVAAGNSLTGVSWDFGNPASGSANTSTLVNPIHAFTSLGTYTVSLIFHYSCGGGTDTIKQVVNINQPCISVSSTSITCASLGSATVNSTGGIGPYSYTWMPGNQTGSVATGLNPGTYTLTVHDFGNNFTYTALTQFTSLIPLAGTTQFQPSVACFGASTASATVINITGGSPNQTYLWTNGSLTYTSPTPTTLSAGLWSLTVTDALTFCQVTDVFIITQPFAIGVQMSASSPTACVNHTAGLSALANGGTPGYSYLWNSGPALPDYTVSASTAGTHSFYVTVTDTLGCTKNGSITIAFIPNPVISVANNQICPLETGTLVATGATTYTWNNNITGNTFTATPSLTTLYSVTGSAMGCTAQANAYIIIKALPNPLIGSNSPRCETSQLQLFANGGSTYVWDGPQNFSATGASPVRGPLTLADAGVYQVTVTAANNCTASVSTTLIVYPTPTLTAGASTVCTTQTLNLNANSVAGASYLWTGPAGYLSNQQNPIVVLPQLSANGDYSVLVTSVETCTNLAVVSASVILPPVLVLTPSSHSFCAQAFGTSPSSISLGVAGANSYSLSHSSNLIAAGTAPAYELSTQAPFVSMIAPAGVTVTGSNGICTSSVSTQFSIIPNPTIQITSASPVICAGETYTYTMSGATSYKWGTTVSYSASLAGDYLLTHPNTTSIFSVEGLSLGCISDLVSTQLTVNPIPSVKIYPSSTFICLHNTATLQASGSATDFYWQPSVFLNTNNGPIVLSTPPANQTYTVTGTALNCSNTAVVNISVLALPVPSVTASKKEVCIDEGIMLAGLGGRIYTWSGPLGVTFAGTPLTFTPTHLGFSGAYTLAVSDSNNCVGFETINIKVNALPGGSLLSKRFADCVPFCSDFTFVSSESGVESSGWSISRQGGGTVIKKSGDNFTHCFISTGDYKISGELKNSITGCKSLQVFAVNAYEKPTSAFVWSPEKPVEEEEIVLKSNSVGEEQTGWSWHFTHDGNKIQGEETILQFHEAGNYPVAFVVENKWGCKDTTVKVIEVLPDFAIYMPNAFTPNTDNINEVLKPTIRGIFNNYSFQIFNRWGERLFLTMDHREGWDGTFNGLICKQDTYVWIIELSTEGEVKKHKGTVLIYR